MLLFALLVYDHSGTGDRKGSRLTRIIGLGKLNLGIRAGRKILLCLDGLVGCEVLFRRLLVLSC